MDLTVLHLAVPQLSAALRPSSSQLLWIVDIYGFMVAGFLITMGTLGDRIGRRRLLLIGAAAFGAASVTAAFSTSAEMLIAGRALLGVAGATLAPSTLALIRNMFHDPQQRTTAISVWVMSFVVGAGIGPLIGGALLEFFWWGSVLLIGLPVMALLLVLGPRLLPEYRAPHPGRLDLPSTTMALLAVLAVIYGLKQTAVDGLVLLPSASLVAGILAGVLFVRRQRRLAQPLIDLHLFAERTMLVSLGALTLVMVVLGGISYLTVQYLQLVLGLSPLHAGLWTLPPLAAGIVATMLTPLAVRRVSPGLLIGGGPALAAAGYTVVGQVGGDSSLTVVVVGLSVAFAGLLPVSTVGVDIIVAAAPPERTGAASAISETTQELGTALGIALLGSLAAAIYRGQVAHAIPTGDPRGAAEAIQDTLGGATGAADQFPTALLAIAKEAFTAGLQTAALTSAVALAGMAAVAMITLRHSRADVCMTDQTQSLRRR